MDTVHQSTVQSKLASRRSVTHYLINKEYVRFNKKSEFVFYTSTIVCIRKIVTTKPVCNHLTRIKISQPANLPNFAIVFLIMCMFVIILIEFCSDIRNLLVNTWIVLRDVKQIKITITFMQVKQAMHQ